MKKIIFFVSGLFFSFNVFAQAPTPDVFNATAPKRAKKLSREQLLTYLHSNYKRSGMPLDKENTYQLDSLLISYWSLSINEQSKKTLKASQAEVLGYLTSNHENVINYSKIITVNNIQYLTVEYQKADEVFLYFISEFNKDNKNVNGLIQFKSPDKNEAHQVLNDLLASIRFKE